MLRCSPSGNNSIWAGPPLRGQQRKLSPDQIRLFNEAEVDAALDDCGHDEADPEETVAVPRTTAKKAAANRCQRTGPGSRSSTRYLKASATAPRWPTADRDQPDCV